MNYGYVSMGYITFPIVFLVAMILNQDQNLDEFQFCNPSYIQCVPHLQKDLIMLDITEACLWSLLQLSR